MSTLTIKEDVINSKGEVLFKKGKAVPAKIKTGLRTNTDVQILEGVNKGDTVITSAIIQLRPGVDVSIRNFK